MNFDDYEPKLTYPDTPKKPEILRKSVSDLTDEEIVAARSIKRQYERDVSTYKQAKQEYQNEQSDLYLKFRKDLAKEFDIRDGELDSRIFAYAWQQGHSEGYRSVYNVYSDIVDIIKGTCC